MPSKSRRDKKEPRIYSSLYAVAALYLMLANIVAGIIFIIALAMGLTGNVAGAVVNLLAAALSWLGLFAIGQVLSALADIATNTLETRILLQRAHASSAEPTSGDLDTQ